MKLIALILFLLSSPLIAQTMTIETDKFKARIKNVQIDEWTLVNLSLKESQSQGVCKGYAIFKQMKAHLEVLFFMQDDAPISCRDYENIPFSIRPAQSIVRSYHPRWWPLVTGLKFARMPAGGYGY